MQIGVDSQRAVENKRIYVIDDDEITRAALQFMLHDENEAHEFGSLSTALEKAASWPPDLVLLGGSPLADGGAALPVRLKAQLPSVKVLAVCNDAQQAVGTRGLDGVIQKPLRLENVRAEVDAALGRTPAVSIPAPAPR